MYLELGFGVYLHYIPDTQFYLEVLGKELHPHYDFKYSNWESDTFSMGMIIPILYYTKDFIPYAYFLTKCTGDPFVLPRIIRYPYTLPNNAKHIMCDGEILASIYRYKKYLIVKNKKECLAIDRLTDISLEFMLALLGIRTLGDNIYAKIGESVYDTVK